MSKTNDNSFAYNATGFNPLRSIYGIHIYIVRYVLVCTLWFLVPVSVVESGSMALLGLWRVAFSHLAASPDNRGNSTNVRMLGD